ncbi:MAG: BrnT family toxin [Pyrinomonadaceae bacterium]|nr:BrnT family toxin [Pyrinomonadaceae bacterium]
MFEWDIEKAEANLKKHGISFYEAETAFEDFYAIEEFDDEHSNADESRFKMLAMSAEKILVVVYTMRGENYRIISAREAEKYERELYEKQRSEQS